MPKYGAYSKSIVLARPDRRTREGRLLRQMRQALFAHLGGEARLTPPQRVLIERACMLQLRVATLDEKIVDGTFTDLDSRTYLAFSNTLRRTMLALGVDAAAADKPVDPFAALHARLARRNADEAA
jgi:hypothetical protein